jgi:hypothetical protein
MVAAIIAAIQVVITSAGSLFTGWRALTGILLTVILPVVLYNAVAGIISEVLNFAVSQMGGIQALQSGSIPTMASISMLGAWCLDQLRVPQAFSYMIACIGARWILRMIPFVRAV